MVGTNSLQEAWKIQKSVVFALFTRELKTRFGEYHLGYFWALAEPLAMVGVLSALKVLMSSKDIGGLPYPIFFASGILPYLFFNSSTIQALSAIEANLGLLNYRRVKPADAVFTRVLLEGLIYGGSLIVILIGFYNVGYTFRWNSTLDTLVITFLLFQFSLGIAFIAAVVGPLFKESKKFVPIILRPFFFLSGIFFSIADVPVPYQTYLLYNPLLHVVELFRQSMFTQYESVLGSFEYFSAWSFILFFFGLCLYRTNRKRIMTSGQIK